MHIYFHLRILDLLTCRCCCHCFSMFNSVCVSVFFSYIRLRPHLNQLKAKIMEKKNERGKKRKDMKNNNFSLKLKFCYDTLEIYRNSDFFLFYFASFYISSLPPCRLLPGTCLCEQTRLLWCYSLIFLGTAFCNFYLNVFQSDKQSKHTQTHTLPVHFISIHP